MLKEFLLDWVNGELASPNTESILKRFPLGWVNTESVLYHQSTVDRDFVKKKPFLKIKK